MIAAAPALTFAALLAALTALPAMRHLGYPLAVATTFPAVVLGAWAFSYGRRCLLSLAGVIAAFAMLTEPFFGCDLSAGIAWTALGPGIGAVFGFALAAFLAPLGTGKIQRVGIFIAIILVDMAFLSWRLFHQPQVMVMDLFLGYIHGPIYDEWVPIEASLLNFRVGLLGFSALLLWAAQWRRSLWRWALCAAVGITVMPQNHLPDRGDLEAQLSAQKMAGGIHLRFDPRRTKKRVADRIFNEARAHLAHLSPITTGRSLPPVPVTIWLYPNAEAKRRLIGAGNVLIARPWQFEIHLHPGRTPDPHLRHELVHALLAHRADNFLGVPLTPLPNPALVEGVAVFLAPGAQRMSLHQTAAALKHRGQLPSAAALLSLRFSLTHGRRAYRAAGSLMRYIADTRGIETVLHAYEAGSLDAAGLNSQALTTSWRAHLDTVADPPQARRNLLRAYAGEAVLDRPCPMAVEAAWRFAQRPNSGRDGAAIEADYRAIMGLQGNCLALASLADRLHRRGRVEDARRIEDEMLQRGLPPTTAARLFVRRGDVATAKNDAGTAAELYRRALAAAPREHIYRALLVRRLLLDTPELAKVVFPYITSGKKGGAASAALQHSYPRLSQGAAAAAAYLLMRWHGNQRRPEAAELWGQRARPLSRTLEHETRRYLAALAQRSDRPCQAIRRWNAVAAQQPAFADRLPELIAAVKFHHPKAECDGLEMRALP